MLRALTVRHGGSATRTQRAQRGTVLIAKCFKNLFKLVHRDHGGITEITEKNNRTLITRMRRIYTDKADLPKISRQVSTYEKKYEILTVRHGGRGENGELLNRLFHGGFCGVLLSL